MNSKIILIFFVSLFGLYGLSHLVGKSFQRTPSIIFAHNMDENHPVHKGMVYFKENLESKSEGRLKVQLYANGQLGREREVIELLQLGAVAMTKVSSLSLEAFVPHYSAINLPYLFRNRDHFFSALDGDIGQEIHLLGIPKRFRGLSYYDSGSRSFYANKPIMKPEDLKGLKIRVMGSQTAITMMKLLGGSPTPMGFGEIYTGLQQNVIDGAENNIMALTLSRHGEVAKHYSLDEHIMAPDVIIISESVWQSLSQADQKIVKEVAEGSAQHQRKEWLSLQEMKKQEAQNDMNVSFHYPKKEPFMEMVLPLHEKAANKDATFKKIIETIKSYD